MTVLLVLATFLVLILADYIVGRRKAAPTVRREEAPKPAPLLSSASIEGVLVPDQLRYHPGHTWFLEERPQVARIGADALAAKLIGTIDKIELPKTGRWVRQGQKAVTIWSGGEKVELVSPAEGEILEINQELAKDPTLLTRDPYGRGWVAKVSVPDFANVERNLLPRSVVRPWMKEEVRHVRAYEPQLAAVVVMGGGQETTAVHTKSWSDLTREIFLG
jgi:glycine cleavage system H protein